MKHKNSIIKILFVIFTVVAMWDLPAKIYPPHVRRVIDVVGYERLSDGIYSVYTYKKGCDIKMGVSDDVVTKGQDIDFNRKDRLLLVIFTIPFFAFLAFWGFCWMNIN